MKKVGILTFHYAYNYGAVLQCYALAEALKDNGYNVEILDYRPDFITNSYNINNMYSSKRGKLARVIHPFGVSHNRKIISQRYKAFDSWKRQHYSNLSPKFRTKEELKKYVEDKYFDVIICGSDQIWNKRITNNDSTYYLDFETKICKRVSFSASFGVDTLNSDYVMEHINKLKEFDSVAVREKIAVDVLNDLGVNAKETMDPVFLLASEEWKNKIIHCKPSDNNYIFIYCIGNNPALLEIAKRYANILQMKIVYVHIGCYVQLKLSNAVEKSTIDPTEFLKCLCCSKIIITNSYHGTSLSIILNKPFITVKNQDLNSRIDTLLNRHHMEARCVNTVADGLKALNVAMSAPDIIHSLNELRCQSLQYLNTAIYN